MKELLKLGIDEASATAASQRSDLFAPEQPGLSLKTLERKLTQIYLVRLQKLKFIKSGFRSLINKNANQQYQIELLIKTVFADGCTRDDFVLRMATQRGINSNMAQMMSCAFDDDNG